MSKQLVSLKEGRRSEVIATREASLNRKDLHQDNASQIAFTLYVIAIAAKLANVEKTCKDLSEQIASFKEIFSIPESECSKVDIFYKEAVQDKIDVTHYANQLKNLFPNNRLLLEELVDDLFAFADADASFTEEKARFLKKIILSLNLGEKYFLNVLRKNRLKVDSNPFKLLNVSKNVSYVDLKKSYRRVITDCHPDRFANNSVMPEFRGLALEQFNHYTEAYEAIKLNRGFNNNSSRK